MSTTKIYKDLFENEGGGEHLKIDIMPNKSIYISPSGNDSNDGLTSETSVKTFAKAFELSEKIPADDGVRLVVVGGTYTESLIIEGKSYVIELTGDVTISGRIEVDDNNYVEITGAYTLTINCSSGPGFACSRSSFVRVENTNINIVCGPSAGNGLYVGNGTSFYLGSSSILNVTMNTNTARYGILVDYNSLLVGLNTTVTVSSSKLISALVSANCSKVILKNLISDHSSSTTDNTSIRVEGNSYLILLGANIRSGVNSSRVILADYGSCIALQGEIYLRQNNGSAYTLLSANGSVIRVINGTYLTLDCSTQTSRGIVASDSSSILFDPQGTSSTTTTLKALGKYTSMFALADRMSLINIAASVNVVNSATGKRFQSSNISLINTNGGGASKLPGNTEGTISSTTYSMYT